MANLIYLFSKNPAWATDLVLDKDDPRLTSLIEKGWDPSQRIPVRNAREDEREAWPAERQAALDKLLEQIPESGFKYRHDGEVITVGRDDVRAHALPKQASKRALAGHHRAFLTPLVDAIRRAIGLPPIEVTTYSVPDDCDDELVAVSHNIAVGQREMSPVEKLRVLISFVKRGVIRTEAQAISTLSLKRTEGQKLFSWACVAARFPEARIAERVTEAATPKDDDIPLRKLSAGAARAILEPAKVTNGQYSSEATPVVQIIGPNGASSHEQVCAYLESLTEGLVSGREASRGIPIKKFKDMRMTYKIGSPQAAILDALIAADEMAFVRALDNITGK